MTLLHPFWAGVFCELRKEASGDALALMADPYVAGAVGAVGAAAGLGAVALARKLRVPGTHQPAPAAAGGFRGKHLALAGLGGAALGAYAMKKREEQTR